MSTLRQPFIVAHRGASAAHPENTVEAFRGALAEGADWVELDVRLSADGQLVVHHDPFYSGGVGVATTPAASRPASVPLLDEALDACAGMGVNVEIKNTPGDLGDDGSEHRLEVAELVVSLVTQRDSQQPIQISSFDEPTLARVKELAPGLPTAQLLFDLAVDPQAVERAADAGHGAINPWDPFVDEALVARCGALGLEVNPWTVDDPDRIRALAALGVTGIITNTPAAALAALG